jgi:hypothetical protein
MKQRLFVRVGAKSEAVGRAALPFFTWLYGDDRGNHSSNTCGN